MNGVFMTCRAFIPLLSLSADGSLENVMAAADEPPATFRRLKCGCTKTRYDSKEDRLESCQWPALARGANPRRQGAGGYGELRHGFYSQAQSDILAALGEDPERFENLVDSLTELAARQ